MSDRQWGVHIVKRRFRYMVSRLEYSNFAGSWYELLKNEKGKVKLFWLRRNAEDTAEYLNDEQEDYV